MVQLEVHWGFSESTLKFFAGLYQLCSGTSSVSYFTTFFDDPIDQYYINKGIEWYGSNY